MAGREYSLGGFGGQLRADDLARAYALAGGAPLPVQAQPAPTPDMSVQRAPGRPMQQIRAYSDQDLADSNRRIALAGETGEVESAAASKRADMRAEQAQQQKGNNEQARADTEQTRAHKKGLQAEQDRLLEEMRANIDPPSRSAGERVWGVLGGILAMASKGRAAAGVQLISQLATSGREERWARAQQSRSAMYQAVTRGIDLDNATEEQQLEVSRRLGAAEALYWDAAIEGEKERGMSAAMKREAESAQLLLRQKAREALRGDAERDAAAEAAAQKAAGAAQRNRKEQWFWDRSLPELNAMPDDVLGELGQKIRASKQKMESEGVGGQLNNEEKRQKLAQGPSANLSADERKVHRLLTGVAPSVQNLRSMAERGDAPPHPYTEYAPDIALSADTLNRQADISAVADIVLRDESGAAIGKDEQLKKLRGWGVTSGDPKVRARGLKKLLAEYDARLGSVGGAGGEGGGQSSSFQAGTAGMQRSALPRAEESGAPMTMVSPDGKSFKVHPSRVQQLEQKGWSRPTVAGGTFIPQAADLFAGGGGPQ